MQRQQRDKSLWQADYAIERETAEYILLRDLDNGGRSVTNDAERVVREVLAAYGPQRRIFYIDSMGATDELTHDGVQFTGFKPGGPDGRR